MGSSGLNLSHLKQCVVIPTLKALGAQYLSAAAINLLTGTAEAESACTWLYQIGGPALGLWQMEEATHDDCWNNWIRAQVGLPLVLSSIMTQRPELEQLQTNLAYACAMARIKYMRSPLPLPGATDAVGLAEYHAAVYNAGGKANPVTNTPLFQMAIAA